MTADDGTAFRSYTGGWVTLPNETVNDRRLSFRARGLLAYLVGRPPGWAFSADRIAAVSPTEGRDAIRSALRELEAAGYVRRRRLRVTGGRIRTITEAAATPGLMPPIPSPETDQPSPVQPTPDEPTPDNPSPKSATERLKTERVKTGSRQGGRVQTSPPDARPRAREGRVLTTANGGTGFEVAAVDPTPAWREARAALARKTSA